MISVVMPAYNASKFIALAINSILNQTFQEFELIVIDDGSTDDTLEIIKRYIEQDNRVRVIQGKHVGLSHACNLGVNESRYPWIARMDADDIALPERFEKQMNAAKANPKVVAWGTYVHHINSKDDILSLSSLGPTTEQEFDWQRKNGHISSLYHPTALLKKEIMLKIGGYRSEFEPAEDLDLFNRMADYGPILAIPEPLLLYRVHSHSASMQRFFAQKLVTNYIIDRYRAQLSGSKELSYDKFVKEYNGKSLLSRLRRNILILGMFHHRKAGLLFADRQYLQSTFYLAMSVLLNSEYSIGRVWRQIISPKAHNWLKLSKSE